jgi:hypothetical protein
MSNGRVSTAQSALSIGISYYGEPPTSTTAKLLKEHHQLCPNACQICYISRFFHFLGPLGIKYIQCIITAGAQWHHRNSSSHRMLATQTAACEIYSLKDL